MNWIRMEGDKQLAKKWIQGDEFNEQLSILRKIVPEPWIGWLAGIIDGEGTITITPRKRTDGTCKHEGFQVSVRVANTDLAMIRKIEELTKRMIGSTGYVLERRPNRCKKQYYWMIASRQALVLLKLVKPYLVTKSPQARIAIELQERISTRQGYNVPRISGGLKGSTLTTDEYVIREKLFHEIKLLNVKGGDRYE